MKNTPLQPYRSNADHHHHAEVCCMSSSACGTERNVPCWRIASVYPIMIMRFKRLAYMAQHVDNRNNIWSCLNVRAQSEYPHPWDGSAPFHTSLLRSVSRTFPSRLLRACFNNVRIVQQLDDYLYSTDGASVFLKEFRVVPQFSHLSLSQSLRTNPGKVILEWKDPLLRASLLTSGMCLVST